MKLSLDLGRRGYDIVLKRGVLTRLGLLANLGGQVLVVADAGLPPKYLKTVLGQCGRPASVALPAKAFSAGEAAWLNVLEKLRAQGFGRDDLVVALGGAGVAASAGFAAACHLHGMPYCVLPTTTLAQAGAAVGGQTGLCLEGGTLAGVYHQPCLVAADPDLLGTQPARSRAGGMAEVLKMALVGSRELFELLEALPEADAQNPGGEWMERMLYLSLRFKKGLVEQDEEMRGAGRLGRFGHTVGRALWAAGAALPSKNGGPLTYGECLALGMLPMLESHTLARRTRAVMKKLGLPLRCRCDAAAFAGALAMDEDRAGGGYYLARVKTVGQGYIDRVEEEELRLLAASAVSAPQG